MKRALLLLSTVLLLGVMTSCNETLIVKRKWMFIVTLETTYTPDIYQNGGTVTSTATYIKEDLSDDEAELYAQELERTLTRKIAPPAGENVEISVKATIDRVKGMKIIE